MNETKRDRLEVFISSTSRDLEAYRLAARDVVLDLGWHPVAQEHFGTHHLPTPEACRRYVADSDVVLLIQAFRRGTVPGIKAGGDGRSSFTGLEIIEARRLDKPIVALLAEDNWPGNLWDDDPESLAWVKNFRAELNRIAETFHSEGDEYGKGKLEIFKSKVRTELNRHLERIRDPTPPDPGQNAAGDIRIRTGPAKRRWPARPYPVLVPYRHPDTFGGRDAEIERLDSLLGDERLILTMRATSGAGKSSLLLAGLVPRLEQRGVPVAIDREPWRPGLARRLAGGLLETGSDTTVDDNDPVGFADLLARIRRIAGHTPVLVLDQFEDVFSSEATRGALARLGPLLAATAQTVPGLDGPPCRWLLSYRHEFHGKILEWLQDVLAEARRGKSRDVASLPHDLSGPERVENWVLPVFAPPSPGEETPEHVAAAFLDAIEKPLRLEIAPGRQRYSVRFEGAGASRLADAFARARRDRRDTPLIPQLQVVLSAVLDGGEAAGSDEVRVVALPEDPGELDARIEDALRDHLRRALEEAFPIGADRAAARRARACAILALERLADAEGRRGEGLSEDVLQPVLGEPGSGALARLASDRLRVVLAEPRPDGRTWYRISHDRLAELVTEVARDPALRTPFDLDEDLLDLDRWVSVRTGLFGESDTTKDVSSLSMDRRRFQAMASHPEIRQGADRQAWWEKCVTHRRRRLRRLGVQVAAAVGLVAILVGGGYSIFNRIERDNEREKLELQVQGKDYPVVLAALVKLVHEHEKSPVDYLPAENEGARLHIRDIFDHGLWSVDGSGPVAPPEQILGVLELVGDSALESREVLGALVWSAEELGYRFPAARGRAEKAARRLTNRFVEFHGLPTPKPEDDENLNARIPIQGDRFRMGSDADEAYNDETPRWVRVSEFAIQEHEVTNEEYWRFDPDRMPEDPEERKFLSGLPIVEVSWYEATAYAAWLDGSLPTEAQWEFAARGPGEAPRPYPWGHPPEDGEICGVFANCSSDELVPVRFYENGATPPPAVIYDLAGNVWEWCRDWYAPYPVDETDQPQIGPPTGAARVLRGGAFDVDPGCVRAVYRSYYEPGFATSTSVFGWRLRRREDGNKGPCFLGPRSARAFGLSAKHVA